MIDFRQHLREQIDHIRSSMARLEQGHQSEAARIAVAIRIICHQPTRRGSSLLNHLGVPEAVMLSTTIPGSERNLLASDFGLTVMRMGTVNGVIPAFASPGPRSEKLLPFPQWWTEPIARLPSGELYTRKDLILDAADTDGGAHVDEALPRKYEALKAGFWTYVSSNATERRVQEQYAMMIAQVAYEVGGSPGIIAIHG